MEERFYSYPAGLNTAHMNEGFEFDESLAPFVFSSRLDSWRMDEDFSKPSEGQMDPTPAQPTEAVIESSTTGLDQMISPTEPSIAGAESWIDDGPGIGDVGTVCEGWIMKRGEHFKNWRQR